MKNTLLVILCVICLPVLGLVLIVMHGCSAVFGTAHKAINTTAAQFDPATMLKRYEWFKDAAAQCEKKLADIAVYERRFQTLKADYEGKARSEWTREDRSQYNIWLSEVSGIQASYNGLAAEYNANMAKLNYAFTNVGELPKGATQTLPREFKPYILQ